MGDHSILVVDESQNRLHAHAASTNEDFSSHRMDPPRNLKLVECRICHDEDEDSSMETPCACCGSLKYAHRRCVQRWCNEKGNTICEICLQPFKPGYTSPPQLFCYGGLPMNFRGNWEISRRDLFNLQFSAMVATDHDSLESEFDEYIAPTSRSLLCCRIVSIFVHTFSFSNLLPNHLCKNHVIQFDLFLQFMVVLVLRHTLPIIINGTGAYSIPMFMLLGFIVILLPICIMARGFTAVQHRHQHSDHHDLMPDEGNDERQPHFVLVH